MEPTTDITLDSNTNQIVEVTKTEKRSDPSLYLSDLQNKLDAKQQEIDGANQTLQQEINNTEDRQEEIRNRITLLTAEREAILEKISKTTDLGVVIEE